MVIMNKQEKKLIKNAFLRRNNLELVLEVINQSQGDDCLLPQEGNRYAVRSYGLAKPNYDLDEPNYRIQEVIIPVIANGYKLAGIRQSWFGSWR